MARLATFLATRSAQPSKSDSHILYHPFIPWYSRASFAAWRHDAAPPAGELLARPNQPGPAHHPYFQDTCYVLGTQAVVTS